MTLATVFCIRCRHHTTFTLPPSTPTPLDRTLGITSYQRVGLDRGVAAKQSQREQRTHTPARSKPSTRLVVLP